MKRKTHVYQLIKGYKSLLFFLCRKETPFFLLLLILTFSCNHKKQNTLLNNDTSKSNTVLNTSSKVKNAEYGRNDIVKNGVLDNEGNLWFGTTTEGVYKYDGKTFINFSKADGLSSNFINAIIQDRKGALWFGTDNGLSRYDGKTFTRFEIPWDGENDIWGSVCNPNVVLCMLEDKKGLLWIGTCGGGAYSYNGETFTKYLSDKGRKQADSLYHNVIKSMVEDTAGNIWFTSLTHGGVSCYDGETFTHFADKEGLTYDMISSSFLDKRGTLWFGSLPKRNKGLFRYNGKSFINITTAQGLCSNEVSAFFEDKNGKIWLCTEVGVCCYDGKTFTPFTITDGSALQEGIGFVTQDKESNIWFGGRFGKLLRYDGKTLTDFTKKGNQ